jgi:hypothetical protein
LEYSQDWISLYLWNSCLNVEGADPTLIMGGMSPPIYLLVWPAALNNTQLCFGAFGFPISHACGGSRVGNSVFNIQQLSEFILWTVGISYRSVLSTPHCWPAVHICNWAHLRTQNLQPVAKISPPSFKLFLLKCTVWDQREVTLYNVYWSLQWTMNQIQLLHQTVAVSHQNRWEPNGPSDIAQDLWNVMKLFLLVVFHGVALIKHHCGWSMPWAFCIEFDLNLR